LGRAQKRPVLLARFDAFGKVRVDNHIDDFSRDKSETIFRIAKKSG
jgi:hypothetical protein